jgi:hypothetical protein
MWLTLRKALTAATAAIVLFFLLFFLSPVRAADSLNLTGTRNSDGTVTLNWSPSYHEGKGKFKIKYKLPGYLTYLELDEVEISKGGYTDKAHTGSPNAAISYRLSSDITSYKEITVKPYEEPTDNDESDTGAEDDSDDDSPFDDLLKGDTKVIQAESNAGYIEKFLAEIIMIVPRFIYHVVGINEPLQIVFNRDINNGMAPLGGLYLYTFTGGEYGAIEVIYETLRDLVPVPLVIAVAIAGILLMVQSANTNKRLTYQDYINGFFVCVLLVQFGHYLWQFIFGLNYYLVEAFYTTIEGRIVGKGFIDTLCRWDTASAGMAVIAFITVLVVAIMTWQYALRKIMLAMLLLIFPAMAVASVFPQTRGVFNLWIKELASNLFLQSGHAAALALFLGFTEGGSDFWTLMAFLLGLNSIAVLVRRVIGADTAGSGAMGHMGTMLGLGSIMALSRMGNGLMGGKMGSSPAADMAAGMATAGAAGSALASTATGGAVAGLAKGAAVTAASLAGGTLAGMATGNPGMGILAGGAMGAGMANKFNQLHSFVKSVGEEAEASGKSVMGTAANRLGIFSAGQLYDGESAAQIGKNLLGGTGVLGGAGSLAGRVVSAAANAPRMFVSDFAGGAAQAGRGISDYRQKVVQDMGQARLNISNLTPQYEAAKQQLEIARSPARYPDPVERKLAIDSAQANLQTVAGQMAENKLALLDGSQALSNDGMKQKIEQIRAAHEQKTTNGGINGFNWNALKEQSIPENWYG